MSVLGYRGGISRGGDADAFRIRIVLSIFVSIFDINVSLMQGASQPWCRMHFIHAFAIG